MILRGGENVYSVEVENLILMNPKALQVAVVGVPDQVLGEKIKAVVFPMPGHTVTADEVRESCMGKIADYKVPDFVVISETPLPMNPGGKIVKCPPVGSAPDMGQNMSPKWGQARKGNRKCPMSGADPMGMVRA